MSRVAIILGSTRTPSIAPNVAALVTKTLEPLLPAGSTLTTVSLRDYPLAPYITGPPPIMATPGKYDDAQTNAWSNFVSSLDAVVFLTSQYNASLPPSLKLALDVLYHEWAKKPVFVVSYGGAGGTQANEHLRAVATFMKMNVCEKSVELPFGEGHNPAGGDLQGATLKNWSEGEKAAELKAGCEAFVAMLGSKSA
ncbi:FMN-red domain-containing protein [Mycena chlorophos]|uniref:FMN-red domain-containing protein n=1 Tax=Mycena chlorophos TaxID=658473 RepID=A0A8H6TJF7_MYCCL|nr:FMN-red domain-containing protein [Mycena chlorophos]